NMLARTAHSCVFAIEAIVVVEVLQQQVAQLGQGGRRQVLACAQVMVDFTKNPGAALCGSPDHHGVGPCVLEYAFSLLGGVDIAIGDDRHGQLRFHFSNSVVFGLAGIQIGTSAAVQRQSRNADVLS